MTEKRKSSKNSDENLLNYIKIDQKNYIEELSSKEYIALTSSLLKSFSMLEDHIGSEINTFFNLLLPESKENDTFKINTLVASKSKTDNTHLENCLNEILNRPELNYVILTKELCEQLATIIKEVYKKIKKKYIKNFEQLVEEAKKFWENSSQNDILKKYRIEKSKNIKNFNENETILFNDSKKFSINSELNVKSSKSAKILNKNKFMNSKNKNIEKNENENLYKFKKLKEDNSYNLPIEMLILIRKFNYIKKLRLVLNTETNSDEGDSNYRNSNTTYYNSIISSDSILEKNDIENFILVFLNLEWLFPNLKEIDSDLTSDELTEYLIENVYSFDLKIFSDVFNRDNNKLGILPINSQKKRIYDPVQKSLFSIKSSIINNINSEDHSSDKFSSSMTSNNINHSMNLSQTNNMNQASTSNIINSSFQSQEEKNNKILENFFKKYSSFLEIIIIYGYFIKQKMSKVIQAKFTLPINFSNEISKLLKKQKVMIENFHFFSFINNQNILHTTIDFNSLDVQTFEKVLYFLNQNQLMTNCNISFFTQEEYFRPEMLLKILQNCNGNYKIHKNRYGTYVFDSNLKIDIYPDEDIETYILRKLSKFFEKNLSDLFNLLTIKTSITDLSLFFDIPNILVKNGIYNNILLKFFMNIFIFIDNSINSIKNLSIIAENFILDKRKYEILDNFLENLNFNDLSKDFKIEHLIFNVKMFHIKNIYRLISFNLTYLSIGEVDYITFNSFVNYFISTNFRDNSKLIKLKITLNRFVFDINTIYSDLIKLFTKFPKKMDEISIFTSLIISFKQLNDLILMTNYNQLINIFMLFNIKSIEKDKKLEELLETDITNFENDGCINLENAMQLFRIKRNKNVINKIINLLINLNKKNPKIVDYKIYFEIKKFLCVNERKKVIIQFKS